MIDLVDGVVYRLRCFVRLFLCECVEYVRDCDDLFC